MLQHLRFSGRLVQQGVRAAARGHIRALSDCFAPTDTFLKRHVGPTEADVQVMLQAVGFDSLDGLTASTVPPHIRLDEPLFLDPAMSESEAVATLKRMMAKNVVNKSFIGMGYYETLTPAVIQRNMLENPGWYTAYTPYQAEIAQGRLQSLLNFQTMVADLTAMKMCNASLLDEATAAAEALNMTYALANNKRDVFFVDKDCHPQTIGVIQTRAEAAGVTVEVGDAEMVDYAARGDICGVLVQYPNTFGVASDLGPMVERAHAGGAMVVASTDLMASALLKPVGEMGVDIAVGSAQRFGVPMGYGGPHAGFLATTDAYSRKMPGRIIGVSVDSRGKPALRMAMQTREQHIRRDKATSNICTAQALLANMAAMYGVYHGPDGVKEIATRIHGMACATASTLRQAGYEVETKAFFDTFVVNVGSMGKSALEVQQKASSLGVNVRVVDQHRVGIAFGESISRKDTECLLSAFEVPPSHLRCDFTPMIPPELLRTSEYMTHPVFNTVESETQMLRYLKKLESMDLSLNTSMISLGSCTMKLNATSEMIPITWPEIANLHPFAPDEQTDGFREMIASLHKDLAEITGFAAVSSQPNSGANGEYAGLLAIRSYHRSRGEPHRNICLIPVSAHGTNPASAAMAGMKVQIIKSDAKGDVDLKDLRDKVEKHKDKLAALMITYPSTFGKFEEEIKTIIDLVHANGGQVYMDGANMNAQCGLTSPGHIGADVCHLNLHKTFCIPHGGGGPGVGTIGVAAHLAPFLPGSAVVPCGGEGLNTQIKAESSVSAAPYGSASILPITWMYIKMLGEKGLKYCSQMAILNANYMAKELEKGYQILYRGKNGQSAHEFIINLQPFKEHGIVEEDVAKRLQDYGFHSPTMSWPVAGTLMVEPTESEDKAEMDRFVTAMLSIRKEIDDVVKGRIAAEDSPLKGAPHTMDMVYGDEWTRAYSRTTAAFPAPWTNEVTKFWPTVGRLDNVYGDRNLVCSCPPMSVYE